MLSGQARQGQINSIRQGDEELILQELENCDLIAKAQLGHVDAYSILVSRWEKRVYNYLFRLLQNREDALDITQDAFLKAFQQLKQLDNPDRFPAWLFRIAHNQAYSMLRKSMPKADLAVNEPRTFNLTARMFPAELRLAIESAVKRLSTDQRDAVLLRIYQGLKFEEMAKVLACPVSTAKSRLYTALTLLKETLAPLPFT